MKIASKLYFVTSAIRVSVILFLTWVFITRGDEMTRLGRIALACAITWAVTDTIPSIRRAFDI